MYDSLKIFDLGYAATLPEVTANFRALARIYHPDQHNPERTGLSSKQEPEIKLEPEIKQEPFTIQGCFGFDK